MRMLGTPGITLALGIALITGGCATVRRHEAMDTEMLLAAAGFIQRPADTEEKLTNLKAMPALKLVSHSKDGHIVYTYADPYSCRCLYVGGPQNYQEYQRLAVERQIARDKRIAAEQMRQAVMDWTLWGPWWW